MIDKRAFLRELGLLADRFGRTVSEPVIARYYDTLNRTLTTTEFEAAARIVFDTDTFWPAPARFIELAHGNPENNADAEWRALLESCARNDARVDFLTPEGRAGMIAAGGWRDIGITPEGPAMAARRKSFIRAYLAAREERSMTLGGLPAPVLPGLPS